MLSPQLITEKKLMLFSAIFVITFEDFKTNFINVKKTTTVKAKYQITKNEIILQTFFYYYIK